MNYKISVHLNRTLTYFVDSYEVIQCSRIRFVDKKTGVTKDFDSRLCEIEILKEREIEKWSL